MGEKSRDGVHHGHNGIVECGLVLFFDKHAEGIRHRVAQEKRAQEWDEGVAKDCILGALLHESIHALLADKRDECLNGENQANQHWNHAC